MVLYGYLTAKDEVPPEAILHNGHDAANLLLQIIEQHSSSLNITPGVPSQTDENSNTKLTRSYGNTARNTSVLEQDSYTGAITEALCARLPPIGVSDSTWSDEINKILDEQLQSTAGQMMVFGRRKMTISKFNAEMDVTHRRVEYLLPADFLFAPNATPNDNRSDFLSSLPSFTDGSYRDRSEGQVNFQGAPSYDSSNDRRRPDPETLRYLHNLKKLMQRLTTHIEKLDTNDKAAVLEKDFNRQKRHKNRHANSLKKEAKGERRLEKSQNTLVQPETKRPKKEDKKGQNVLRRKRYHNFTPSVLAHDFLAYRRLDRIYHRATLRFSQSTKGVLTLSQNAETKRPFLVLSLSGDIFLTGQVCRIVGLFIALSKGVIDEDFCDCVFDEAYPHLVSTPAAPTTGMYAGEAYYMSMEGKCKAVLTPRKSTIFQDGWNDDKTLQKVYSWQQRVRADAAAAWMALGEDKEGRLLAERDWTKGVLEPWAIRAKEQLKEYRQWKMSKKTNDLHATTGGAETRALEPPIASIETAIPSLFEKVLRYLRDADKSGFWPSTTPKRQLVMVSTVVEGKSESCDNPFESGAMPASLSVAHMKARSNKIDKSSAYIYVEGEGGASGSFSVGAMPGEACTQPKGNELFPELMRAAFELEIALCPNREPSSTIAINRNAQFRPHTDSGAGAGQSSSLIVGLGSYSGGELVVEGEQKDIRYRALEFNGWKQRHWTMPFHGERFSLVWFTPKGCEGVRGIDLCKNIG